MKTETKTTIATIPPEIIIDPQSVGFDGLIGGIKPGSTKSARALVTDRRNEKLRIKRI